MQYRLLDLVCCPSCKADVAVEVFETRQRTPLAYIEGKRCCNRCAYVEARLGVEPDCLTCSEIEVEEGTIQCGCGKLARMITLKMPHVMVQWTSFIAACIDYGVLIWPYKMPRKTPGLGKVLEKIAPPRVKGYAKHDFHVSYTDWFDRLSYPCVNYYSADQVRGWYERNGLTKVNISPTGPFAWRGFGVKP